MRQTASNAPPIVPFLKRDGGGRPYLAGSRCGACGQLFVGERTTCAKCTTRGQMQPARLAESGTLYAFTVVHRSFPGVKTPFVDAIVDLDDGAHLKGTLTGVVPDAAAIAFGMPVKIAYLEATPVNAPGEPHLSYCFVPA